MPGIVYCLCLLSAKLVVLRTGDAAGRLKRLDYFRSVNGPLVASNDYTLDARGRRTASTSDARWLYWWDAENRLTAMEEKGGATGPVASAAGSAVPKRQRLEFAYDGESRRVRKRVLEWSAEMNSWLLRQDLRFLYDGWSMIAEFEAQGSGASSTLALAATYAWGLDLSGTETGAGGVGGLMVVSLYSTTQSTANNGQPSPASVLAPCYDGNGNVLAYADTASGAVVARYEYDPFGQIMIREETSSVAGRLHHQFSTKYADSETGLVYYGFRYYSPELGRWVSRDPIGERGGLNVYGAVENSLIDSVDYFGLAGARLYQDWTLMVSAAIREMKPLMESSPDQEHGTVFYLIYKRDFTNRLGYTYADLITGVSDAGGRKAVNLGKATQPKIDVGECIAPMGSIHSHPNTKGHHQKALIYKKGNLRDGAHPFSGSAVDPARDFSPVNRSESGDLDEFDSMQNPGGKGLPIQHVHYVILMPEGEIWGYHPPRQGIDNKPGISWDRMQADPARLSHVGTLSNF